MTAEGDTGRPRHLLVVDDEQRIADTLALILESKGYRVTVAYEAASALAVCRSTPPDLVISDVMMPGMNGVELAVTLRHEFPKCKVLLFSGQAATADILEHAREHGYEFDLLAKPVHPEELLRKLEEMLSRTQAATVEKARG